jgi:hypothetical protein
MTTPRSYTIREAARRLRISPEAVRKAIKLGRLKAKTVTIPRQVWSIAADSLDLYEVSRSHQERGLKKYRQVLLPNLIRA